MRFRLVLVALGLAVVSMLALTSCGGNAAVDVVNKFIAAEDTMFSSGDGSGLMAVEDANMVLHMMSFPDTIGSANHVAAIKGIVGSATGPITHEWFDVTGTGDTGSVRWTETGTVGGKEVTYQGAYLLKIKDGKIVEAWLISDMLSYLLAAGVVQYSPAAAQ
jgi:ketosteroid isomerase-like protein